MFPETIFQYITQEENKFDTDNVQVGQNWMWNFKNHVQMIFHLKHGQFFTGENDWMRAFKNIMELVLTNAYWTEDIEVKDVVFYIENPNGRVLSFFVKKYHDEIYVKENDLDVLFDEITESDVDFGGVLVDTTANKRPTVISLTKVAFADQTDICGGPIATKMYLSPSKLKAMEKQGWFKKENGADGTVEDLIALATFQKDTDGAIRDSKKNITTGKNIEVYIVRGSLPKEYLKEIEDDEEANQMENQIQIVGFYYDKKKKKQGFTIYKNKEKEESIKFFTSQEVSGRALGRGWGERMLQPQVWTNFLEIHKTQMLQAGAKSPLITDDETFTNRNKIQDMENLEVATIKEGRSINLLATLAPANVNLFQNGINDWFNFAQYAGASFDPSLGKESASGTTFRGQNQVVQQGKGPHDRLRGKRAKFIEELYRCRILKDIKKEIVKGKKFLATLSGDEMEWVVEQMAINEWNHHGAEHAIAGNNFNEGDKEAFIEQKKSEIQKKGNKHILEWVGKEFEDVEIKMGINIAGKQKDLLGMSDKIFSIIQAAMANPQAFQQTLQIEGMKTAMDSILEYSNVSAPQFYGLTKKMAAQPVQSPQPSPLQPNAPVA